MYIKVQQQPVVMPTLCFNMNVIICVGGLGKAVTLISFFSCVLQSIPLAAYRSIAGHLYRAIDTGTAVLYFCLGLFLYELCYGMVVRGLYFLGRLSECFRLHYQACYCNMPVPIYLSISIYLSTYLFMCC